MNEESRPLHVSVCQLRPALNVEFVCSSTFNASLQAYSTTWRKQIKLASNYMSLILLKYIQMCTSVIDGNFMFLNNKIA